MQSTPESGGRAGYDGHKRRKGSKVQPAVDTLGQLLAVLVTPANEQDRALVASLAEQIQEVTGEPVEVALAPGVHLQASSIVQSRFQRRLSLCGTEVMEKSRKPASCSSTQSG